MATGWERGCTGFAIAVGACGGGGGCCQARQQSVAAPCLAVGGTPPLHHRHCHCRCSSAHGCGCMHNSAVSCPRMATLVHQGPGPLHLQIANIAQYPWLCIVAALEQNFTPLWSRSMMCARMEVWRLGCYSYTDISLHLAMSGTHRVRSNCYLLVAEAARYPRDCECFCESRYKLLLWLFSIGPPKAYLST